MTQAASKIKSFRKIVKMTRAMKAVSAAKHVRATKEAHKHRLCGEAAMVFYESIKVSLPPTIKSETLYVALTSDRGLCGSCNTEVCRSISDAINKEQSDKTSLICIGIVGLNILKHTHDSFIVLAVNKVTKKMPTFLEASEIAQRVKGMEVEFNNGKMVYNEYLYGSTFKTRHTPIYSTATVYMTPNLALYNNVSLETIESYVEFSIAVLLFYAMREAYMSEQAARLKAMDIASRNAAEFEKQLTWAQKKARQAAVTNDMLDSVSCAVVLGNKA